MKNSEPDPGAVIVGAAIAVYGVVAVEIVMYLVATPLFMAFTLALGIGVAAVVGRFINGLLDNAEGDLVAPAPRLITPEPAQAERAPARTVAPPRAVLPV